MRRENGFTFVEVLIAIIFVGLAIAALVAGNGVFTQGTAVANEMSVAEFLTEQIRERTALTGYLSLISTFNNVYSPPRDVQNNPLSNFAAFSQKITAAYVNDTNFTQVVGSNENFIRVTAKIYLGTKEISSTSWIRANY